MYYKTIDKPSTATITEKASKFIGYTFEIKSKEEVKLFLNKLKQAHPKVSHICYAYRLGLDKTDFRVSDDGEPSNSAGRPILQTIDSFQLTNILVAVVRYYGGINLGIPGLIQSYKLAAKETLTISGIVEKEVKINIEVEIPMLAYDKFRNSIKQYHVTIIKEVFYENSHQMLIEIPMKLQNRIQEIIDLSK